MRQVIKFKTSQEHYKADACVVWCFDNRFTGLLGELNRFGFKNIDLVKVAGGAKALANRDMEPNSYAFLIQQIDKSIKLHKTSLVMLMVHKDCGAYGDLPKKLGGDFLHDQLRKAKTEVERTFEHDSIKVAIYLADFDGLWEVE